MRGPEDFASRLVKFFQGEPPRGLLCSLMDAFAELANTRCARIEFVREQSEDYESLRGEFGGVTGLTYF